MTGQAQPAGSGRLEAPIGQGNLGLAAFQQGAGGGNRRRRLCVATLCESLMGRIVSAGFGLEHERKSRGVGQSKSREAGRPTSSALSSRKIGRPALKAEGAAEEAAAESAAGVLLANAAGDTGGGDGDGDGVTCRACVTRRAGGGGRQPGPPAPSTRPTPKMATKPPAIPPAPAAVASEASTR